MSIESIHNNGGTYQGSVSVQENSKGSTIRLSDADEGSASQGGTTVTASSVSAMQNLNTDTQEERVASNDRIKKAVENINKRSANTEAIFGIHEGTNRVTIKIIDKESKKVVKEFPPEKTLDMIEKVWEMAGLMVDEKR